MEKSVNNNAKIENNICPQCGHKEFSLLTNVRFNKVVCDNCKAIFYAVDHIDKDKAGTFTGMYAPLSKENLYRNK